MTTVRPHIRLISNVYKNNDPLTSFENMIDLPKYRKSLFVYNDDEYAYLSKSCERGRGNAVIRPHNRAFGIPTGMRFGCRNVGFTTLTGKQAIIDESIQRISDTLATGEYDTLVYSSDGQTLGTGYFTVAPAVKAYIVYRLHQLATFD